MLGIGNAGLAGSRVSENFVGRAQELEAFSRALDRLSKGDQAIAVVSGEPGIGKTRLLDEVLHHARERGYLTLSGRAAEFERDLPFAVFVDALSDHLEGTTGLETKFEDETLEDLAAIFPPLAGLAPRSPRALQTERHRSYHAVRTLLAELACTHPLVLALDDLHWADEASIEMLSNLLRRLPQARIMFALAYRPHAVPDQLDAALVGAVRQGVAERLQLPAMSRDEAGELLKGELDGRKLARVYLEAGGNPLYMEQLVRYRREAGDNETTDALNVADLSADGVPPLVAASISREIASLDDTTRIALQAASVLGDAFEPDLMAETADVPEADALAAIDRLLALDLIRSTDAPRRFCFRHPLVRRAVYESTSGGWRIAAHMRAADELERRDAPPALRAHHVERSARSGDDSAIELLTEAANATAPRAPAVAAGWYEAALQLLPESQENVPRRLRLLVPLGIALGSTGQLERSREVLRNVLDLLPEELTMLRGAALSFNTTVEVLLGNAGRGKQDLIEALERIDEKSEPAVAAEIMGGIAITCFFDGGPAQMRDWASRAVELFGDDAGGPIPVVAMGALALAEYTLGNIEAAGETIDRATSILDSLSDNQVMPRPAAFVWLGWAELLTERFDQAIRHFDRGIAVSREGGQEHLLVQMMHGKALALLWQGKLDAARQIVDPAIESSMLSQNNLFLTVGLGTGSWIEALAGQVSDAVSLGERAVRASDATTAPMFRQLAIGSLAEAWLDCGEHQRCRDMLVAELDQPDMPTSKARALALLCHAELELGNTEAAELWASEAEHIASATGLDLIAAMAGRSRAAVRLAQRDFERAADAAREAARHADRIGAEIEAARARMLEGRAAAELDKRDDAVALLNKAQATLLACGAAGPRSVAVRELRKLGRRVSSRSGSGEGLASLTPRELEVARLAAQAKRNREIAAELFISEKTVEQHLGRVFAKLGLSSRVAIAAALESLGEAR